MAEREYRRLTRAKNRSLFAIVSTSRSSLWLGKDHLLQIDTSGYTESYKRFYFRDIQALVLSKTDTWLYVAVVFAALASLFGLIAGLGGGPVIAWIFGSICGIFAVCMLFDLVAGPTSKCYLRTAVQTERLVSITRLRRARKVFETLRPLIHNAQGELRPSDQPPEVQPIPPVISAVPGPNPLAEPVTEASSPPTQDQA
jgi:hypothetical protein